MPGARGASTWRASTAGSSPSRRASGWTPRWCAAATCTPERKARYKQWYFAAAAVTTFAAEYVVHPPQLETHVDGRVLRGVTSVVQNGDPFTYFKDKPIHVAEGVALDDGRLGGAVLHRATPLDVPPVAARLLSKRLRVTGHRRVGGWSGATRGADRLGGRAAGAAPGRRGLDRRRRRGALRRQPAGAGRRQLRVTAQGPSLMCLRRAVAHGCGP